MSASRRAITSRVTVQNPRPRKYASAAEKQAAFRARFPTLCVRVEPKTADTIQKIGDASGRSQQETMLSLVKFALTNRDFVNLGLTEHKQLPRIEEPRKANPMKRKPTPAQIAARERFAAMARSGAFKKKAAKARKNPAPLKMKIRGSETPDNPEGIVVTEAGALRFAKANMPADLKRAGFVPSVVAGARGWSINYGKAVPGHSSYKRNPISDIANIIYNQLGANRFAMMTGAKNFVAGDDFLMFSIGKNQSVYNKVRITLTPDDLYDLEFFKMNRLGDISKTQKFEGVYAEQLQDLFTQVTGLYTSMGTMGRRSNPRASNPVKRKVMKEKRPFYYIVKVGSAYDGQFLSTHYSLDDVKKIAQQKADKYGAQAKITEFHM